MKYNITKTSELTEEILWPEWLHERYQKAYTCDDGNSFLWYDYNDYVPDRAQHLPELIIDTEQTEWTRPQKLKKGMLCWMSDSHIDNIRKDFNLSCIFNFSYQKQFDRLFVTMNGLAFNYCEKLTDEELERYFKICKEGIK